MRRGVRPCAPSACTLVAWLPPAGFSLSGYDLSVEPDFWPPVGGGAGLEADGGLPRDGGCE